MMFSRLAVVVLAGLLAAACGQMACGFGFEKENVPQGDPGSVDLQALPEAQKTVVAFLGDSLTAGSGLTMVQAFPALIGQKFLADGYDDVDILNAGVSGDTTAGGLRRLEQVLGPNVRILVVALGANDALRGLSVAQTRGNLKAIIDAALGNGTEVLLAGMEAPTNYGEDYRNAFRNVFTSLAAEYRRGVTFVPFLLEGVAGIPQFNQADGIHPNEQGARMIADHLYPALRNMVDVLPVPSSGQ
jgi:acyl-CoA thioesterase-1